MTLKTRTDAPDGLARYGLKFTHDGKVVDVEGSHTSPEFVDAPELRRNFGIKRSLAYDLIARGLIRSVSLRQRGALRGKRLFEVHSVREYLHKQLGVEEARTEKARAKKESPVRPNAPRPRPAEKASAKKSTLKHAA